MYIDPYNRFYLRLAIIGFAIGAAFFLADCIGRLFGRPLNLF